MVQDGRYYLDPDSEIRFAVVLDNLIHKGEIPVTVGVFVDPGEFPGEEDPAARRNRNLEFDTYSDAYSRLLLEEILPPILRDYRIADDPDLWAVAGGSSGGDCPSRSLGCGLTSSGRFSCSRAVGRRCEERTTSG